MAHSLKLHPRTLHTRLILLRGVARRFFINIFCKRHKQHSIAARKGKCKRCGVCCHLVANKCWALRINEKGSVSACRIYKFYRPPNCTTFPIDPRDIAERDLIAPDSPCGYYWEEH